MARSLSETLTPMVGRRVTFEEISLHSYRLGYTKPVRWSDTSETGADYVLLRLVDHQGAVGYAEATPKPTWSGFTTSSLIATLREVFVPLLANADLERPGALLEDIRRIPGQTQARGMVESALWMLHRAGAQQGQTTIPLSYTLTRESPTEMAEQAQRLRITLGFTCFKLKGGQGMKVDLQAAQAVRSALPDARIYVDANSAYSAAELPAYSAALAEAGVEMLEDPCPLPPFRFSATAATSHLPLMVDFSAADAELAAHFAAGGAAAVSAKPGRYGIPEALRVAAAAEQAGKAACIGLFGESDLGTVLNLALWQEVHQDRLGLPAELSFFLGLSERVLHSAPKIEGGALHLPSVSLTDDDIDFTRMQSHACQ